MAAQDSDLDGSLVLEIRECESSLEPHTEHLYAYTNTHTVFQTTYTLILGENLIYREQPAKTGFFLFLCL